MIVTVHCTSVRYDGQNIEKNVKWKIGAETREK